MIAHFGTTSSSELGTLGDCPKKYAYRYVQGLVPLSTNKAMSMGTFWHACAAAGYRALAQDLNTPETWLSAALAEALKPDPVDRDNVPLGLDEDDVLAAIDMLTYYFEHVGQHDRFDEILVVDEEKFFPFGGWNMRVTIDLVARFRGERDFIPIDHKTSGDINSDMAHLPLDLQTHLYYYGVWKMYGLPPMFIHNFQRRFDFTSSQMTGPPQFRRADGYQPYLLTQSGKMATRSNDPNDYVRRVRTPLNERQLVAFEAELTARLRTLSFHHAADVWPRHDTKLGFGCSSCPFYAPCTTSMDGREINQTMLDMLFRKKES